MNSKKRQGGADAENALSADLVLTPSPRVTTTAASEVGVGGGRAQKGSEGTIALSTLHAEERELLALADGKRSVGELVRLSGLPAAVAQKHLRSLRDRGILMKATPTTFPARVPAAMHAETSESPAVPDGSSALTKAIDEYLELAASAITGAVIIDQSETVAGAETAAQARTSVDNVVQGATTHSGMGAGAPVGAASGAYGAADQSGRFGPQVFKPNVTAFWLPSMAEIFPEDPDAPLGSSGGADGAPAGSAPTVIVAGSPATPAFGSGAIPSAFSDSSSQSPASGIPYQAGAPIPFRVGDYEVATRIAQGGMGSIYVCRRAGETGFQRLFTLKVVRQHSAQRDEAVRSFKREAEVGALLTHPNLQTVLDVGSYKDQPFLVLDYVEGTSLSDLASDDRRAPVPVVVSILLDVLRGLEHAHELTDEKGTRRGLVHGDISPQNVLVGVDGAARLTDFGSASFTGEGTVQSPKWSGVGKPAYMAPEQLRAELVDARTDVFAVGILMWSALTAQKLFAGDTYDETIIKVLRKKIPPPSAFGSPAVLDEICLKALSRSREGRYASAEDMARELTRVAAAEHLIASAAEVGQWVRRESGETLGEQKRRIQVMFGGGKAPSGRPEVSVPTRTAAATIVLDTRGEFHTPKLGAHKTLPARTVFLRTAQAGRPSKTFWQTWSVVIISTLVALPVTLTIGYFVSNLLVSSPAPSPAGPSSNVSAADAATSQ